MKNIILTEDGKYRWIYEYPMNKNLDLLYQVWKVLLISAGICVLLTSLINLLTGNGLDSVLFSLEIFALIFGILAIIAVPAYFIVARANGNIYTVMFEMDGQGIEHIQLATEKTKALEMLTVLAGLSGRSLTTAAAGFNSISRNSLYTEFPKVTSIRALPQKNMIKLNTRFTRNQIYVEEEDFSFVLNYITSQCPNARVN